MSHRNILLFSYLTVGFLVSGAITAQETVKRPVEIRGTLLNAENDSFMLRGVIMISAEPSSIPSMSGKTEVVDTVGTFDIKGVSPGRYFFTPEGPQAAFTYFKKIECGNVDYSTRALEVRTGDLAIDCKLSFARDSGTITGQVLDGRIPVRAFQVIAIPEAKELRSVFGQWAVSWAPTKRDGRFEVRGVIPGNYLVFAMPADSVKSHIPALDFDDRDYASAQHLTIGSREAVALNLKPIFSKP